MFSNVNVAYSDLLNKISDTIDNVAPLKEIKPTRMVWWWHCRDYNSYFKKV